MQKTITLILITISLCSGVIILPPNSNQNGQDVGIIFLQGAQIEAKNYMKIHQELQNKFSGKLWIALPEFLLSTPQPLEINSKISEAFDHLKTAGLSLTKDTPFFFVGHSLGGIMIQDYLFNENNQNNLPVKFAGLILEGSYVARKHLEQAKQSNIPSILTIGGDLDGLNRITRMAESYYFENENKNINTPFKRITLIVTGINHYQFSTEGNPPYTVRTNDIKAEKTDSEAINEITSILSSFMSITIQQETQQDTELIQKYQKITAGLLDPIIDALQLEGSYYLVNFSPQNFYNIFC